MVSIDPTSDTVRTFCSGAETGPGFCSSAGLDSDAPIAVAGALDVVRVGNGLCGWAAPARPAAGDGGRPTADRTPRLCSGVSGARLFELEVWLGTEELLLKTGRPSLASCTILGFGSLGSSGEEAGDTGDRMFSTSAPL